MNDFSNSKNAELFTNYDDDWIGIEINYLSNNGHSEGISIAKNLVVAIILVHIILPNPFLPRAATTASTNNQKQNKTKLHHTIHFCNNLSTKQASSMLLFLKK